MKKIIRKINRKICSKFGHKWRYYFTNLTHRMDARRCLRCGQIQHHEELMSEKIWSNVIEYTKLGALEHWGDK